VGWGEVDTFAALSIFKPPFKMATLSDPAYMFEGFIRTVQDLAQDSSFRHVTELVDRNSQLAKENTDLNIMHSGSIKSIAQLQNKVEEAQETAKQSRSDLEACQNKIQSLTKEQKETSEQVEGLTKQLKDNDTLVSDIQKKVNKKQDAITRLKQQLSQETLNHLKADSAQKELQSRLDELQQEHDGVKASLKSFTALTTSTVKMPRDAM
jgi:chromosome segregation ATPase